MKTLSKSFVSILLLSTLMMGQAHAQAQFGQLSDKDIKGVKLAESMKLDATPTGVTLKRITQGLRQKKVVFVWASVYVAQFFSNAPTFDYASTAKLRASLVAGAPLAVSMTFVRDVGIDKIIDGFKDVLKANAVDATKAPFADFLDAVKKSGDVKDKQNYIFVLRTDSGKDSISFQTNGKEAFAAKDLAPGAVNQFLSLWLGKPVDSGLEQLQEQILLH